MECRIGIILVIFEESFHAMERQLFKLTDISNFMHPLEMSFDAICIMYELNSSATFK